MTPVCCNCLYFRDRTKTCHNPDFVNYHEETRIADSCPKWEYWREFADLDGRRLRHGPKR